jgi:hypothetical protein
MDGLEVNTAHCYTPVQNVTELGLGIGKAQDNSGGKLGLVYKRINPSCELGLFCVLYLIIQFILVSKLLEKVGQSTLA